MAASGPELTHEERRDIANWTNEAEVYLHAEYSHLSQDAMGMVEYGISMHTDMEGPIMSPEITPIEFVDEQVQWLLYNGVPVDFDLREMFGG